jgi:hypothetical protein
MSLLASFLTSHLLPALESALAAHEPEVQAAILAELQTVSTEVGKFVMAKLEHTQASA